MGSGRKTRVLICDDSALIRKLLSDIFARDPELEVVGLARDPYEARELIKSVLPDVLTLDVEMPRMDGLTFLGHLMRLRPMPVVMISSLTDEGAEATLTALELGAVDYVHKPNIGVHEGMQEYAELIIEKVKTAARARVFASARDGEPRAPRAAVVAVKDKAPSLKTTDRLIAIGASTGGTEAVADLLASFPPDAPGTVVVQHIPEVFSKRFAERLDASLAVSVSEARDGDRILLGHVYIAPGNKHLRIVRNGAHYHCAISDDPAVNRHRPSVDVLFRSAAEKAGRNATGVILTGMGKDGAEGLLEMRNAGSMTFAQDEESSVVWGMPGEAVKRGAAVEVLPLSSMAARVLKASVG